MLGLRRIRIQSPEEVASRNHAAEVDPRAAGLADDAPERIWRSALDLYATGFYPAVALCVRRRGQVIVDGAIGHERVGGRRATPKSLFGLFSASKAITAMVVHLLDERGLVHLDDAVCEYIPEFARHGKEWITLRHLLTHRAGIPSLPAKGTDVALLADWDGIVRVLCDVRPTWKPGRRLAYHALTGGYVLGEVVRRVTGRDIRRFLREEILAPLGFRNLDYGVSAADVGAVVENTVTGPPVPPPMSWLLKRSLGAGLHEAVAISNDERFLTAIIPAGNNIGTADEACRFYQLLLDEGEQNGVRVFHPRTIRRAVAEQAYLEFDLTLGVPVRYGMGFMLGSDLVSIYGHRSPRAFGHVGFTNVVTYADPDRELAVALMTSGKPFIHPGLVRWLQVMRTIAAVCPPTPAGSRRLRARSGQ
jgi:CubicO group peptidase (beta-lactamase class C family)